ncbi:Abnormal cell lineage protein 44 [Toxocara canis]|uniref:Abnormal cell lineage protein 44 n=1 Tax=Toxocara canis TaxID=6265 RepID=A0A0B2W4M8_TOXCA|nr:Abnormal cell lineage protein 44 [Toxocara canis]
MLSVGLSVESDVLLVVVLVWCCAVEQVLPLRGASASKAPEKLTQVGVLSVSKVTVLQRVSQGCSPELLHLRSYRHFHVLCRTQPAIAVAAYEGIQDSMAACREHMRFQPWDCSQVSTVLHEPPILRLGQLALRHFFALPDGREDFGL